MTEQQIVLIDYTNWRGERRQRPILIERTWFGSNEWHPDPQWFHYAIDLETNEHRNFALLGIHGYARP